jgi:hypothetical protein
MLLERNPAIMHDRAYIRLKAVFTNMYYWTASRRLPELDGADLEESLSLARHCLSITCDPDCSIRAPVKPDVVH